MEHTLAQYRQVAQICSELFAKKLHDYGAAWRILRSSSLTDQLFIKAMRIRTLEVKKESKVDEGIRSEYIGIVNYALIALIQLEKGFSDGIDMDVDTAKNLHAGYFKQSMELMTAKNHDYGEAWRKMRISSLTDLILMKIHRVKQIEDNQGATIVSEGVDANYMDMINYAMFALIKLDFGDEGDSI